MASETRGPQITKLNGENYQSWKFNMKCLLMERGLWGYVRKDNPLVKPVIKIEGEGISASDVAQSRVLLQDHELKADKAYSHIALSVERDLQVHVSSQSTAREAWEALQNHFEFVSVTQIVRLTRRFYAAKMDEKGDIMKHITEMTSLAEQLREMKEEVSNKKFAIVMLGSLPESYDNFLTSLNARNADDLDWTSIKSLLVEEHMKRQDKEKQRVNEEALFTSRGGQRFEQGNRGGGRTRGGGPGSFRRGGGRPGRFNNHPYNNNNRFPRTCYNCNQPGHLAASCPQNEEEQASLAVDYHEDDIALITTTIDDLSEKLEEVSESVEFEEDAVKPEEISGSVEFEEIALISSDEGSISHEWCVDSGASKHMTNNNEILHDFKHYDEPRPVYLGDKRYVLSYGEGKLRLRVIHPSGIYI